MTYRTAAQRMSQMGIRFGLATEDDVLEGLKYKSGRVMAYPAKRFLVEGDRPKQRYPGMYARVCVQSYLRKITRCGDGVVDFVSRVCHRVWLPVRQFLLVGYSLVHGMRGARLVAKVPARFDVIFAFFLSSAVGSRG